MTAKDSDDQYSDAEAVRRRDAIIRNMIATPPKKHEPLSAAKRAKRRAQNRGRKSR